MKQKIGMKCISTAAILAIMCPLDAADIAVAHQGGTGVCVEKFTISRDDSTHECFPSLTRCSDGRIILVYRESDGHEVKTFCRLVVRISDDDGKTFSDRKVLVETKQIDGTVLKYNCPKVQQLNDGRILVICDSYPIPPSESGESWQRSNVVFFFSEDNGNSWSAPQDTGVHGIMPDEVVELDNGDWLLATHFRSPETGNAIQCASRTTDEGESWQPRVTVASRKGYDFCEASIIEMPGGQLVCYMRENSRKGRPVYKCISEDGGKTWEGPFETLMGAGHRPVAHLTDSGKVMITYRHYPGAKAKWAKNTFAFLESVQSALEEDRSKQSGVVLPLDHDRSPASDSGYTGWVEVGPGQFFAVNYIVDDAPKAQIRGYRFGEADF